MEMLIKPLGGGGEIGNIGGLNYLHEVIKYS